MIVLAMDYENAYSKEINRKIIMQSDAIREINDKTDKNKEEILNLHYKINVITLESPLRLEAKPDDIGPPAVVIPLNAPDVVYVFVFVVTGAYVCVVVVTGA